jgi:flagellar basal-body rod protein FlgB
MNDIRPMLERVLDGTALRQRVLAHNLANLNTPGFKRQDVEFRRELAEAMRAGHEDGVAPAGARVFEDGTASARPDGNTVSLQKELGSIAENGILYDFATRVMSSKHRGVLKAIHGQ